MADVQGPLNIRRSVIFGSVAASYQERVNARRSRTETKTAVFKSFQCFFLAVLNARTEWLTAVNAFINNLPER